MHAQVAVCAAGIFANIEAYVAFVDNTFRRVHVMGWFKKLWYALQSAAVVAQH